MKILGRTGERPGLDGGESTHVDERAGGRADTSVYAVIGVRMHDGVLAQELWG